MSSFIQPKLAVLNLMSETSLTNFSFPTLLVISSTGGSLCPQHPPERGNQAGSRAWPDGACGPVPRPGRAAA